MNKKELAILLNEYDIGRISSYKKMPAAAKHSGGVLTTDKGKFTLKIGGMPHNIRGLLSEFVVMSYLEKKQFPYKLPKPLLTKSGRPYAFIESCICQVYPFIQGRTPRNLNTTQIREVAQMMATYHSLIKGLPLKGAVVMPISKKVEVFVERVRHIKNKISKSKIKEDVDLIFLKEADWICSIAHELSSLKGIEFAGNIYIHGDIQVQNLLFRGDTLVGLLDFRDLEKDLMVTDIVMFMKYALVKNSAFDVERIRFFLGEYNKKNKLRKWDIKLMPKLLIYKLLSDFLWNYKKIKNNPKKSKVGDLIYCIKRIQDAKNKENELCSLQV